MIPGIILGAVGMFMLLIILTPSRETEKNRVEVRWIWLAAIIFLFWYLWHRLFPGKDKDDPPSDEKGGLVDQFIDIMK
jgi:hypothetical protein